MKDAYYFPHDSNAREDPKLAALRQEFGFEGVGIWWAIVELMHNQNNGKFEKFPAFYVGIASVLGLDEAKVKHFFSASIDRFNLFQENDKYIWSERVQNNLRERLNKRMKRVDAGRIGGLRSGAIRSKTKQNEAMLHVNEPKESKVKEKKDTNTDVSPIPSSPKPMTEIQKVITVFKLASGFEQSDKVWDKTFFPRYTRDAKELIEFFGNWKDAADCVQDTVEKIKEWKSDASISLGAILTKHAAEWKKDKQERSPKNGTVPNASLPSMPVVLRAVNIVARSGEKQRQEFNEP